MPLEANLEEARRNEPASYGAIEGGVPLSDVVECLGLRLHHAGLLILTWVSLLCPALANSSIPFLIEHIKEEYSLDHTQAAAIGSAVLFGSVFGVVLFGWLNDRIGRKRANILAVSGVGACCVAHLVLPRSHGHEERNTHWYGFVALVCLRTVLGVFFGGVAGYAHLVLIEFLPAARRGMVMSTLSFSWSIGNLLTISVVSTESNDWRTVLAAPAVLCVLAAMLLCLGPESPRWLYVTGRCQEGRATLNQAFRSMALVEQHVLRICPKTITVTRGPDSSRVHWKHNSSRLWKSEFWHLMLCTVLIQVSVQGASYSFFVWNPVVMQRLLGSSRNYGVFAYSEVISWAGTLVAAWALDAKGRRKTLIWIMAAWTVSSWMLILVPRNHPAITATFFVQTFASAGVWPAMTTYCAECFPTVLRGMAGSVYQGCGRASAVVVPILLGAVLDGKALSMYNLNPLEVSLCTLSLVLLLGMIGAWCIPHETAGAKIEDI